MSLIYDANAGPFSMNNQLMFDMYESTYNNEEQQKHIIEDELGNTSAYQCNASKLLKEMHKQGVKLYQHMSDDILKECFMAMAGADYIVPVRQIQILRSMLPTVYEEQQ